MGGGEKLCWGSFRGGGGVMALCGVCDTQVGCELATMEIGQMSSRRTQGLYMLCFQLFSTSEDLTKVQNFVIYR